jgi:hypothetical protein
MPVQQQQRWCIFSTHKMRVGGCSCSCSQSAMWLRPPSACNAAAAAAAVVHISAPSEGGWVLVQLQP